VLRHLRVTNFAILSDVTIELGPGLAVLTGETGAGKSLIVEAVNLLRGGRASADIPRAGAAEATVEAIVEIPADLRGRVRAVLTEAGLPLSADDDGGGDGAEVVIRRVILRGGKSRTYINGALTTAGRLAELGAWLIDLAGQHQHQGLVDPARHRAILDAFADEPAVVAEMAAAWDDLAAIDAQIAALGGDDRQRAERADFVRFQKDELDAARVEAGEDERLVAERTRLSATEELRVGTRSAAAALFGGDGEGGALDGLARAAREVDRLVRLDASLDPCRASSPRPGSSPTTPPGRCGATPIASTATPSAWRRSTIASSSCAGCGASTAALTWSRGPPSWRPSSPRSPTATPTSRS
jgi:DNA repair protein RecN (Recombination protein N)